ncbi:hypothetical protein VZT92_016239 [Zoarces viviparus]|uniref:Uncharacterized protein n=1 Tax=Zoarces viviparus TaxID=48416 RepID=A0AAW1ES18_ZOAVI
MKVEKEVEGRTGGAKRGLNENREKETGGGRRYEATRLDSMKGRRMEEWKTVGGRRGGVEGEEEEQRAMEVGKNRRKGESRGWRDKKREAWGWRTFEEPRLD